MFYIPVRRHLLLSAIQAAIVIRFCLKFLLSIGMGKGQKLFENEVIHDFVNENSNFWIFVAIFL